MADPAYTMARAPLEGLGWPGDGCGSTNFDNRSFALNEELNVALYDRSVVARLVTVFEQDLARSTRVTYEAWKNRGLTTKLFEIFVVPIRGLL